MTLSSPFVVEPDDEGRGPWKVLADGTMTGGAVMFGDARLPPHTSGPSLHIHEREDEAAYVIEGLLTFQVGERRFAAGPGTLVWLPRNVEHTFANLSDDPVWAFGATVPAGLEAMFAEQSAYFASLAGPPDEAVIAAIGNRYGVHVVGPPLAGDA